MSSVIYIAVVEAIIKAAGMDFDVFQFQHGKYGMYQKKDILNFLAMSKKEYDSLSEENFKQGYREYCKFAYR